MNQRVAKLVTKIAAEKNSEQKLAQLDELKKLLADESTRLKATKKTA